MKKLIYCILISFLFTVCSFAQAENKFKFSIDYSPNISRITDPITQSLVKLSHNGFIKMEYSISKRLNITTGVGFLNTGERTISDLNGALGISQFKSVMNFNYIVVPIGLKKYFGSVFINPEVSIGIYVGDIEKFTVVFEDGRETVEKRNILSLEGTMNELTIPIMLTVGKDFKVNNLIFYTGIKAYYSIIETVSSSPRRNNNYYGLGLIAGIKL